MAINRVTLVPVKSVDLQPCECVCLCTCAIVYLCCFTDISL